MTPPIVIAGVVIVGDMDMSARLKSRPTVDVSVAFANPKSRTLTCPSTVSYVRRLQIAVNDAVIMGGAERLCDLERNRQRLIDWNGPSGNAIGERGSVDELEDQGASARAFLDAVNRRNVRMIQRRQHLRLALEAREAMGSAANNSGRTSAGRDGHVLEVRGL